MPHTVHMSTKKIIIKRGIQVISQSYEQAISNLSPEQKQILGVSTEEHSREGILAIVQSRAESVTGTRNGAKERWLSAMECNLSEFAFELREAYIGFLNALIQQVKKTAKDAEAEEIESRYVLVRELLLRLLTVGLSDEENNKRVGDGFIAAMKTFVEKVLSKEGLKLNDGFRYTLCHQHPEWLQHIGQAVEIIKLIHLPQSTFTALVNYLDQVKRATQVHILFGCGVAVSASDISEQWIKTSYQTFLLGQKREQGTALLPSHAEDGPSLALTPLQEKKLKSVKNRPVAAHLRELFLLLNQIELLSKMVATIDNLIKASAWVLLLTGKLRFEPLIHYIETHQQRCDRLLDVEKLDLKQNSSACRTLITCNLLSVKGITAVVPDICRKIQQLGSLGNHTLMMKQFVCNLNELLEYEELLDIKLLGGTSEPLTLIHESETTMQQINYPVEANSAIVTRDQMPNANTFWQNNYMLIEEYQGQNTENISTTSATLANTKDFSIVTKESLAEVFPKNTTNIDTSTLPKEEIAMEEEEVKEEDAGKEKSVNTSSHDASQTLFDANLFKDVEPDTEVGSRDFRDAIPTYIRAFFESYQDVVYEKSILFLKQKSLYRIQKKLGEKGSERVEAYMMDDCVSDQKIDPKMNFLDFFRKDDNFVNVGNFCKEVRRIILCFEKNQMGSKKPSGHIDTFLDLHLVWQKRHYELFALKYLCIIVARSDERVLKEFIEKFISENDWKLPCSYSVLKKELENLLERCGKGDIKLRQFMYLAHENLQVAKFVEQEQKIFEHKQIIAQKDENIVTSRKEIQDLKNEAMDTRATLSEVLERLKRLETARQDEDRPENNERRGSCIFM